jgi:GntR family transcriptional regulator, rspAB operon transcriptional repressor
MQLRNALIREDVYARLREEIISCGLAPGADLREANLAERFQVSTSPIRDALLRLEADGLVRVFPRRGYRVAAISLAEAEDLFDLRTLLEEGAITRAIREASDADLAALDRFRHFEAGASDVEFVLYNREFHGAVLALSGNAKMAHLGRNLLEQFDRLVTLSVAMIGQNRPRLVREHCEIIDALQAREAPKARRLIRQHVMRARKRVLDGLTRSVVS